VRRRRPQKYVIVGFGVTGGAALRALLACEPDAEVTVVEAGPAPPGFDAAVAEGRQRRKGKRWGAFAALSRVTYLWDTAVAALDADGRELWLSDGSRLGFGKCLLAVGGGRPRVPARFVDPVAADRYVRE
jgi:3-phenylpropionate/trans-cinnamate dioxygenase ferredoxin reductase component